MKQILMKQAQIITVNEKLDIINGDLLVQEDRIKAIGHQLDHLIDENTTVIDAKGKTLLPGFIQTHIHLCQALFRGQADDMELMDWLRKKIWPLEAAHDAESIYDSAMLGIGELIQGGTTTIVDMETVHHTDFAFQAMAETGIRAYSGKVMMDVGDDLPDGLLEDTSASIKESVQLLEKWHHYDNGRLQYAFCPRFVVSCTEDLLTSVRDLAAKYDVFVHTHAAENQNEIKIVEEQTGMANIEYLDHIGLANERLILAHCIWLNENEKRILQKRRVKMTHCPGSNLKLASGVADVYEMCTHGAHVSLGADGAPCNNTLNMFQEMKLAALLPKPTHGPTAMPATEVLKMATIDGARAIGQEKELGSLEVGKKADLIMLDLNDFHTYPSEQVDPISRIVYSANAGDVELTMIDGKIVMENRQIKTLSKKRVLEQANRSIKRLLDRMDKVSTSI